MLSGAAGLKEGSESAQEFVCWSCHNGTITDSRFILQSGGQHPTGVASSKAAKGFPLYQGKVECGTCHTAHGKVTAAGEWMRAPEPLNSVCEGCHDEVGHLHGGAPLNEKQAAAVKKAGGLVGAGGKIGCRTCHAAHGSTGPKLLIIPSEAGSAGAESICLSCHAGFTVTGMTPDKMTSCSECHPLHKGKARTEDAKRFSCVRCHEDKAGAGNHPTKSEVCAECHSIHNPVKPVGKPYKFLKTMNVGANMCAECHSSSMGRHGPSAIVPEGMRLYIREKGFNVTEEGALQCPTCHVTHNAPSPSLLGRNSEIACLYCHLQQNPFSPAGRMGGTHPVGVYLEGEQASRIENKTTTEDKGKSHAILSCRSCHFTHDATKKPLARCMECHPDQSRAPKHAGGGCEVCHEIHGSEPPGVSCKGCHEETPLVDHQDKSLLASPPEEFPLFDRFGKAAPSGEIGCPTCHDPHGEHPKFVRAKDGEGLCKACHPEKKSIVKNVHDGNKPEIYGAKLGGKEGKGDRCLPCHPPHVKSPLMKGQTNSGDPNELFCRTCHGKTMKSSPSHSMLGAPPWKDITVPLPLFAVDGSRDARGFVSCPTCHDLHSGEDDKSLRRDPDEARGLCAGCHQSKAAILGSSHDPERRGAKKVCLSCHPVHSKEGERPPVWELRVAGVGTWNDRKCMNASCHSYQSIEASPYHGMRSHPVNVAIKKETLPSTMLYDPWGRKGGKLVVCTSCHDIHGSGGVEGEVLRNFLRLPVAGGALCGSCHEDKLSLLASPHNMADTSESAPCGPCHKTHKATSDKFLWGLTPYPEGYRPNRLCRSCHTKAKQPKGSPQLMQFHMRDAEEAYTERGTIFLQWPMFLIDPWPLRTGSEPIIPLYDTSGAVVGDGSLQCISCHDPHRFNLPDDYAPGEARNIDGKFLKLGDLRELEFSVCGDCHAKETQKHYKDYHKVWWDAGEGFHPGLER